MSDFQASEMELKNFYDNEFHVDGMPHFDDLSAYDKKKIAESFEFKIWKYEQAKEALTESFAEYMSSLMDDDTSLFVIIFIATVAFLLLGGMVAFN